MRRSSGRRHSVAVLVTFISAVAAALFLVPAAFANTPVSGAVFTTVNPGVDDTGHCLNGGPGADAGLVDCNIYDGKEFVWLSGGPDGNQPALADGTYFFAVLVPGGQNTDPNDGTDKNLSDVAPTSNTGAGDDWTNRVFTVTNGVISYNGTHDFDSNKIRLMGYDDTTSPGGEYILAVCNLADADQSAANQPGVDPSDCKYDAFKVKEPNTPPAQDLQVSKTAATSYDLKYVWTIAKSVDKTTVKQVGGSATFNYTVTATHDAGTQSNWKVTGQITVFNPNTFDVSGVDVTDAIDNNGTCTVTNGTGLTVPGNDSVVLDYTCTYAASPTPPSGINTATATWFEGSLLHASGTAGYDFAAATINSIDECVAVNDSYAGSLGTVCVGDANPKTFTYSRTIPVPANGCQSYDNTATFTTNDTGTTGSASQTVTVCGPAKTGALTIGFWKTTNGQGLITTYCQSPALANYLKGLGGGSGPFSNAPTTSCKDLASYVLSILSGASASNMNSMLRAQMLGTALDVWFSGPGFTSTKSGGVKPPSNFLSNNSLGTFKMDTTAVCPMVDNTSAGTATCLNNTPSTDAVASGAVPSSPMSMQAILDFAATTPAPFNGSTATPVWYGGSKTLEEVLKNIFDQFNNQLAFGSF